MKTESVIHFLKSAHFQFRFLNEAQVLAGFLAKVCPNPQLAIVGLTEILINAVEHGNLAIDYEEKTKLQKENLWLSEVERRLKLPENSDKVVDVEFLKTVKEIRIKITDQGKGFDWHKYQNVDPNRVFDQHGRGIALAKALLFSKLEFSELGNEITCIIPL